LKKNISRTLVLFVFIWAAATSAAEKTSELIAPGLRHLVISRGEVASAPTYRILIGEYDSQSEADQMLDRLSVDGFSAALDADSKRYRIVIPGLSPDSEAEDMRRQLLQRGYAPPLEVQEVLYDLTHPGGPWTINVLEADPNLIGVRVAHAYDAAIGLETTEDLAERHGALAAINGGFFLMTGLLAGDSQGTLVMDGTLLSEPDRGRATIGFYTSKGSTRAVVGRLSFRGEVRFGDGRALSIDGINRSRQASEIVLFTPEFHRTTLTSPGGAEIIVENGQVAEVRIGVGSSEIPPTGMVLSIGSDRVPQIRPSVRPGATVSVDAKAIPLLPDPEGEWDRAEGAVSAGPLLLWQGKRLEEPEKESISRVFFLARHPRTAVGVRADGTLLFVTVDGRQPETSVGMSIPELTDLMLELGCVSAVNLDGGGSTTMVIDGQVVNSPSGSSPRPNGDAILLFPAKRGTAGY
jgi:hypothetical protein